ncbi:MAG: hypothetical protein FWD31_13870, partial [Planctomycetaceae bacterium]|nr:hypothetical protein [Planctomycetaceae bacterium]
TDFEGGVYTAQDVIDAFNKVPTTADMKQLQAMFDLAGVQGAGTDGDMFLASDITVDPITDKGTKTLSYSDALQGGTNGSVSNTTAKELVDFINSDTELSKLFNASLSANSQTGAGKLTLFNEVAYYGCPYDETGLQFLGPEGSPNIEFSTTNAAGQPVKNQALSISWTPDVIGTATAHLAAFNANASLTLEVLKDNAKYDDMAVRFKQVVEAPGASAVTYTGGPSNAMAYGTIASSSDAPGSMNAENGKFIFEALEGGERYNNMDIKAQINGSQLAPATFSLDEATGTFMITVNSKNVTLAEMMDAFNKSEFTSQFKFELDYSDTSAANTNDGSTKFSAILAKEGDTATLGNTGMTGGHAGGVLEILLYDDGTSTTAGNKSANSVVALVNGSEFSSLFRMNNYAGSDGTGEIHARKDTIGKAYDPNNNCDDTSGFRMITTGGVTKGHMVVNLATDAAGNSITTAADLVAYFDTLTAEQTRGISVSLINAGGNPGTICDTMGGRGILKPTRSKDLCDNEINNDIRFGSSGSETVKSKALAEIVAVNGAEAGFTLFSKKAGTEYEGIKLQYVGVDTVGETGAKYDKDSRTLIVNVQDGVTTAAEVKGLIEKTGLFTVNLRTTSGSGAVTTDDDSISLTTGSYETKPKGGASLMWNTDDTSNEMYIESMETGSNQFVQIDVISGAFDTVDSYNGQLQSRSYGTDVEATANGQKLQSSGNNVSLNTTNLSFTATLNGNSEAGDSYSFDIVSGGALFQLGPDVVSAQQVRLGIPSVMTSDLGGSLGVLSDLRSGGKADLSSTESVKLADRIVKDAITSVSSTRGRLGAIQKATLEANMTTLQNSIQALTSARSDIIDTDFAQESSNLTKYQILVQSGSRVLAISNQLPQYAAQLIG